MKKSTTKLSSNKKKTVGIDYSLSSPAVCICTGEFKFENCKIYYLTSVKKYEGDYLKGQLNGRLHLPYTSEQQRHDQISQWAFDLIGSADSDIFIEGYSFGSKGLVFNLAENMGTLKHKLYKVNKKFEMIVPGRVKKIATGKGNADKIKMYEVDAEVPEDLENGYKDPTHETYYLPEWIITEDDTEEKYRKCITK